MKIMFRLPSIMLLIYCSLIILFSKFSIFGLVDYIILLICIFIGYDNCRMKVRFIIILAEFIIYTYFLGIIIFIFDGINPYDTSFINGSLLIITKTSSMSFFDYLKPIGYIKNNFELFFIIILFYSARIFYFSKIKSIIWFKT